MKRLGQILIVVSVLMGVYQVTLELSGNAEFGILTMIAGFLAAVGLVLLYFARESNRQTENTQAGSD